MRWYEYKMEADDLHAPEDLKAKLLAMADTLPEEEKNRPMMPAQADNTAVVRPQEPPKKAKLIHFPAKQVGALAACLAVCVVDYDTARAALDAALNDAGGYLESSSEYSDVGSSRSVNLTFRVPEENYQSFLDAVAQAGNVTYKSQQADDVTTQYMDVETRLANLEAQRTRLQELQAQADNLSDLLQIETSLTDVQSQIESWQSQLDWYSNQVQQCTVYVNLSEVQNYTPTDESFLGSVGVAFAQGWSNFVNGLQQLAVWLAGAWPVVLVVAAAAAGFAVWHKKRRK